jgi:hypothetical protein
LSKQYGFQAKSAPTLIRTPQETEANRFADLTSIQVWSNL